FNVMATTFVNSSSLQFTLNPQFSPFYSSGTGNLNDGTTPFRVIQGWSNISNTDKTLTVYAPIPTISSVQAVVAGGSQACYININCQLNVTGGGVYLGSTYKIKETGATLTRSNAP